MLDNLTEHFTCEHSAFFANLNKKIQARWLNGDTQHVLPVHPLTATLALTELTNHHADVALACLQKHTERNLHCINGLTHPDFCWATASLQRQTKQINDDLHDGTFLQLGVTAKKEAKKAEQNLLSAMDLLAKHFPIAHTEIEQIVTHVVWFSAENFWSSTDPAAFGALFINPRINCTRVNMLETLLHESGHLHLMIKQTMDPLLLNPNQRAASPLRKDPRPLIGVLHATFVLMRMCYGHKLLLEGTQLTQSEHRICTNLLSEHMKNLRNGIELLLLHAELTKVGDELIREISEHNALLQE